MNIGMLWFDNDPRASLDVKVERAIAYYHNKYNRNPTMCFVHPNMLPENNDITQSGGIEVRTSRSVLPNHFWIGMKNG